MDPHEFRKAQKMGSLTASKPADNLPTPFQSIKKVSPQGGMAEWLGSALQKRVHRFKSGYHLQIF